MTGTLGLLIDGGYSLTAHCHACYRSRALDLPTLAERYGRDAAVMGAINGRPATVAGRALRCGATACRSRSTSLRLSPAGLPSGTLSR